MEILFRYEIEIVTNSDEEIIEKGIMCAKDYPDAVAKLVSKDIGYDTDRVIWIKVESMLDPILDDDEIKYYLENNKK